MKKHRRVQIMFPEETMTKQSFREECDINNIMAKFQVTGMATHINEHQPQYGFATSHQFFESMQIVAKANTMFEELPSSIRAKFRNDPAQFLDFVQDPNNAEELREMGLAKRTEPQKPKTPPSLEGEPKKSAATSEEAPEVKEEKTQKKSEKT